MLQQLQQFLPIIAILTLSSLAMLSLERYYTSLPLHVDGSSGGTTAVATAARADSSISGMAVATAKVAEHFENINKLLEAWTGMDTQITFDNINNTTQRVNLLKLNKVLQDIKDPKEDFSNVSIKLMKQNLPDRDLNNIFKKLCTATGKNKWPIPISAEEAEERKRLGKERYQDQDFTIATFANYKKEYMGGEDAVYKVFLVKEQVQKKQETVGMLVLKKLKQGDVKGHLKAHENAMTKAERAAVQKATKENSSLHGVSLDVVCASKRHLGKYLMAIGKLYADNVNGNVLTTIEATANDTYRNEIGLFEHYNKFLPAMGFTYIRGEKFYNVPNEFMTSP